MKFHYNLVTLQRNSLLKTKTCGPLIFSQGSDNDLRHKAQLRSLNQGEDLRQVLVFNPATTFIFGVTFQIKILLCFMCRLLLRA